MERRGRHKQNAKEISKTSAKQRFSVQVDVSPASNPLIAVKFCSIQRASARYFGIAEFAFAMQDPGIEKGVKFEELYREIRALAL